MLQCVHLFKISIYVIYNAECNFFKTNLVMDGIVDAI